MDLDTLPKPALQEVLLKLNRMELNQVCQMSQEARKICRISNFRKRYNELHPVYTDKEVAIKAEEWIHEIYGDTNLEDVKSLTINDFIEILQNIEDHTPDNKEKIIFYSEEFFGSKFVNMVSKLQAGFIARSLFAGILGSFIVEIMIEPQRLNQHIELFQDLTAGEDIPLNIENFIISVYKEYEGYSSIYNLNDTFTSEVLHRDVRGHRLEYYTTIKTATLGDVDIWDIGRLKRVESGQEKLPEIPDIADEEENEEEENEENEEEENEEDEEDDEGNKEDETVE